MAASRLILEQLGLADMSMEQFLAALNAAGEAAGTRALLMIDAINEGRGLSTWPAHLRSLASEVAGYEHVGLVVSCRSSYVRAMLWQEPEEATPETIGFVEVEHRGFQNHEWEASAAFFDHWGLNAPDFPLLVPEYSNPLFLKLLCQSLHSAGEKTLPRGATGITTLFERFLAEANRRLAGPDRCNYRQEDDPVSAVVGSLAQTMLEANADWVPFSDFHGVCDQALSSREWDRSLAKGLIDEGVVTQDWWPDGEVVRMSYQRLGDHVQASRLLSVTDDRALRGFVADLEADDGRGFYQRSGLLEALAIQLPERRGIELHDLVSDPSHQVISEAFLGSIIWRDPASFDAERSSGYVNSIANYNPWWRGRLIDTVLHVACVPGHPFNADKLDSVLAAAPMPERDVWWTTHINGAWRGESVAWRLIEWARSSQSQQADGETARLAALALSWFLASSNRGLRDSATKALVTLLRERPAVLIELLGRFESVNDPYVAERLYCAAYGCALSSNDDQAIRRLADFVFGSVFADGRPPVHLLLRDYARGIVEVAHLRGVLPRGVNLDLVRPPYQSPWPVRPPSEEALDKRAPMPSHRTLHASLGRGIADFARYTVGGAVGHFEAPNQSRRRRQRRDEESQRRQHAVAELAASLSAEQQPLWRIAREDGG